MRPAVKASVCPVRYCGRLVCAALPLTVRPSFQFDTKTYCSPRCAELYSGGDHHTPSEPHITCEVCCEDRPLTDYIHKIREHDVITDKWNVPVPSGCLLHLAPELLNMEGGTCTKCLRSHFISQLETRGAMNVSCIQSHPALETLGGLITSEERRLAGSQEWLPYAHHVIPQDLHDVFHHQPFDHFIHTTTATVWSCTSACGFGNGVVQPNDTPGFPHVECPGCHERFCTNCKAPWHDKQTCQQHRALHPELHDEDEVKQLDEMARLGARRCPRCQLVIVTDGGCDHVHCEQCHFDFLFTEAERVIAPPPDYVPAPAHGASRSFRGWGKLRQAQEEHTNRNRIVDRPSSISNAVTQHEEGIFYFDSETDLWTPEICELDEIAGRTAGRRYVREPSLDRDEFMAFVAVEGGTQGGASLHEALMSELRPPSLVHSTEQFTSEDFDDFVQAIRQIRAAQDVNNQSMEMLDQQLAPAAVRYVHNPEGPPFNMAVQGGHTDDPNPVAPALTAQGLQQAAEQEDPDDDNNQDEDANNRQPPLQLFLGDRLATPQRP